MALSKSIIRAQDVLVCQLYESDPRLKWKCLDCNLLMCIKCNEKVHPKFKNSKEHTILDIKQLGKIGIQKAIDINNVQCKTHAGQTCCLYCNSCKILVCVDCISIHAGHKFQEIKNVSDENINNIISELKNVEVSCATKLQLKVRRQFTTELDHCFIVSTGHDGSLWILDSHSRSAVISVLQRVKPQNQTLKTLQTIDSIFITDFRILSSGDVLFTDKSSILKILYGGTGKVTNSKFNVESTFITTLHVTDDDKVLLAARSTEASFPVNGRRFVIMMDNEGRKEAEWEYDKKTNKKIFSCPNKITCSKQGNIFVIDLLSLEAHGRIVALSRYGDVVNTYVGHPNVNNKAPFQPGCVVNTPSDNIIVCNLSINILHYLDNVGNFISIIDSTTIGIKFPFYLTFVNHTMYIGCTTMKGSTDKAKLYELECSETE